MFSAYSISEDQMARTASITQMCSSYRHAIIAEKTLQSMKLDEALLILCVPSWEDNDFAAINLCLRKYAKPRPQDLHQRMRAKLGWSEAIMFAAEVMKECKFLGDSTHKKVPVPILLHVYAIATLLREAPFGLADMLDKRLKDYYVPSPREIKNRAQRRDEDLAANNEFDGWGTVTKEDLGVTSDLGGANVKDPNLPCTEWHVGPPSHYPNGTATHTPRATSPSQQNKRHRSSAGVRMPGIPTTTPGSVQSNYGSGYPTTAGPQTLPPSSSTFGPPPAPSNPRPARHNENTGPEKARTGTYSLPTDLSSETSTTTASSSATLSPPKNKVFGPLKMYEGSR